LLSDARLTIAPDGLDPDAFYIKRPRLGSYEEHKKDGTLSTIPTMLLDELHALQIASQRPHPGIIGYHGCRVRRGRITGLVLDKHPYNLKRYIKDAIGEIDKEAFMRTVESAVRHLHSLGLAHNGMCIHSKAPPCSLSLEGVRQQRQALTLLPT
jgi:hypothetical protein